MTQHKSSPLGRPANYVIAMGVALVLGGIEMVAISAQNSRAARTLAAPGALALTATATGCAPTALSVPAGPIGLRLTNASDRLALLQIVDADAVVAERRAIAPGTAAVLSTRLAPGRYALRCGLLTHPEGVLTVSGTAPATSLVTSLATAASRPEFVAPLEGRRVQLLRSATTFLVASKALEVAIAGGRDAEARDHWAKASAAWAALGLVAAQFSDLQNRIAPQAEDLAGREEDPAFVGLSRIEYALYKDRSLVDLAPVASGLVTDATDFLNRVKALQVSPEAIATDAARLAQRLSEGQAMGGLARYAVDDRPHLAAALAAMRASYVLVAPLLTAAQPEAGDRIEAAFGAVQTALTASAPDRAPRAKALAALATTLGSVNADLGLK